MKALKLTHAPTFRKNYLPPRRFSNQQHRPISHTGSNLAKTAETLHPFTMTTKQQVIEHLERLPETASLADFKQELEIMTAIQEGQNDVAEGKVKSVDEAKAELDSWFTK
ncbi:Unannotated [Lentimonas sp. CC19]|nr:Unannotated [Lentimonas sp. CC10]CAA6695382.1 Unannotated [Lentimonas sp. CC19]CAA7068800.1 Unannotated [Lentimonas sp. CC11]